MISSSPVESRFYYGWVMVAVAFCSLAVSAGGLTYSYSLLMVTINEELNATQLQLMLPLTLMTSFSAFFAPFIGPKMDRYPLKWFMLAGTVCLALCLLLISLAASVTVITIAYALLVAPVHGLMGTLFASVLVSRWFVDRFGLAMGIASVGVSVGGFVIPPLLEALFGVLGWRETLQLLSLLLIVFFSPVSFLVRDRRPSSKPVAEKGPEELEKNAFNRTSVILRQRNFWLVSVSVGLIFSTYTALLANLLTITMVKGISSQEGAQLIAIISGVAVFGKLAFGAITDRIDLRIGLASTIILVIAGMIIYRNGVSFYHFLIGSVVLGLAAGNMLPVWSALIARLFGGANYGRVMGLMSPINVAFNILAVPLTGLLYDATGSYATPLLVYAVLLTVSVLWVPAITYTRQSNGDAVSTGH